MPSPPKLKALLIDLNGTIHVGSELTPRAATAVARLRSSRIPFIFCSNNTKESDKQLLAKLNAMGLPAHADELLTSLSACRALVQRRGLTPHLLLSPSAAEEFSSVPQSNSPDCVVLGLYPDAYDYTQLNTAFRILKREPLYNDDGPSRTPVLIAPHKGAYHQAPESKDFPAGLSLGIGAYIAALEAAAGVEAEVVGKPTKGFYELAIQMMGREFPPGQVGIIGDDVHNDLGAGARELGLKRILVRTGKYRPGAEDGAEPDAIYDSFADFVDALLDS